MWNIRRGSLPSERAARAGQPVWFMVMKSYCKEEALNPFAIFLAPCVRLVSTRVRSSDSCLPLPSRAPNLWCHQTPSSPHLSPSQFISYRYSKVGPIPALRGGSRVIALREVFSWLTPPTPHPHLPGHISVQLSFLTVFLPQSFSYVVHNLSS